MSDTCFSEDGTDRWLLQSGLLPSTGVFCDAGCAGPFKYSQTAFLRALGWTGICIDGNPDYAPEWEGIANSTFVQAVLSDKPWVNFLTEPTNSLVSRIHELGTGVPAFKLRQVLETCGFPKIDFLAIDIESSEGPVLSDFLHDTRSDQYPKIIVVEFNSCHKGRDASVFNIVQSFGYELVYLTDSNAVFHDVA